MSKAPMSDVIVIGGGIVGATTAYFLLRAGLKVTLVERHHLAYGASGRNAGFIWLSLRPAGVQLELAKAGLALYPDIIEDIGNSFEFRQEGGLIYCFNDRQLQVLRELSEVRRAAGLDMEVVSGQFAREMCPLLPETVVGATYCPSDAQLLTPKFVEALGVAIRKRGGTILEDTAVTSIRRTGHKVTGVETTQGVLTAGDVVVAAGAWSAPLLGDIGITLPVRPMRLQATLTSPIAERFKAVVYGPLALKQYSLVRELPSYTDDLFRSPSEASLTNVELLECFSQRQDGSVYLGCAMDYPGYKDTSTLEGIGITAKVFAEHVPALRDVEVDRSWACMLPSTPDSIPYVGRHPEMEGLVVAAGHVFGNAAGPITGKMVSHIITDVPNAMDMSAFDVTRHSSLGMDEVVHW